MTHISVIYRIYHNCRWS